MLLRQLLYRCEIRFLPLIANHWLRLQSIPDYEELIRILCEVMTDHTVLRHKLEDPEGKAFSAPLGYLIAHGGQAEASDFEQKFGTFRIAGTDRIIREKMWQSPVSVTEDLWYHGLIYREPRFFENELKDGYILPEDLIKAFSKILPESAEEHTPEVPVFPARPAIPSETKYVVPADDSLPDHFCLALALLRDGREFLFPGSGLTEPYLRFLKTLAGSREFIDSNGAFDTETIRNFLTENRTAARLQLLGLWRNSDDYDELAENCEIKIIQPPDYKKKQVRNTILGILKRLPADTWISCSGFINAVKGTFPQFLRETFGENRGQMQDPDGNDLSGIGSWYQLEGAYLRFLFSGPLKWLGIIQTAYPDKEKTVPAAFRVSKAAVFYLTESENSEIPEEILKKPSLEQGLPTIASDGAVTCSSRVPRYFRYMAARYTEIEKINGTTVTFRITPSSLSLAESHGLTGKAFYALLMRFSKNKVPPVLGKMLDTGGSQTLPATVYSATVLTVPEENILSELLETPRLEKWIIQQINATSLVIDRKGIPEIRRYLMEKGLFVDVQL